MNAITERIDLINSFELIMRERNKKVEMYLQSNLYILLLSVIAFSVTLIIILIAATNEIIGIENRFKWNKMSLLVLLSINFYNAIGNTIYKRIILKHLKFLETSTTKVFDLQLNDELAKLVAKLSKPLKQNLVLLALMMIILIGSIKNMFMDNEFIYYKFFILPVLLFYVMTPITIYRNYKSLMANIDEVENS